MNQSAPPTRVQLVPDPAGAGDIVQQFTTYNTDVAPLTPTVNPRSQLDTPETCSSLAAVLAELRGLHPPEPHARARAGSVSLETAVFGTPSAERRRANISIENGDFRFQRNGVAPTPCQIAWTTPVVKGQWYRFTWHFLFAATVGSSSTSTMFSRS